MHIHRWLHFLTPNPCIKIRNQNSKNLGSFNQQQCILYLRLNPTNSFWNNKSLFAMWNPSFRDLLNSANFDKFNLRLKAIYRTKLFNLTSNDAYTFINEQLKRYCFCLQMGLYNQYFSFRFRISHLAKPCYILRLPIRFRCWLQRWIV